MIELKQLTPLATVTVDGDGYIQEWENSGECCSICGEPFTEEEWDERHTSADGEDCHDYCCDVCAHEDEELIFVDGRLNREDNNPRSSWPIVE